MENIVIIVKYNQLYWGILNQGRKYTSKLLYMKTEFCLKKISGLLNVFLLFHGKVEFFKNLQTINAGDSVEKREPSCNVGGNVNWCSHYGEQCGSSLKKNKTKNRATVWSSNPTPGYISGENHWKKYMYPNVHCSTLDNNQDMEAT